MITQVLNSDGIIDKLIHISDIHIRLYQRREEYEYVFQQLYQKLQSYDPKENNLIVLTGDILHSKIELSPECCAMTCDFFTNLVKYFPVIMIAGNHDALLNNLDRMDSISSIIYNRKIDGLHYLKHTGKYKYGNVDFYVDSLLDNDQLIISNDSENIKVGLYHGSIRGWMNNFGFVSPTGEKELDEFNGLDYLLLGDIHKHQYMNPTSAYAGSLISQNFGESDLDHGYLEWDLNTKKQTFYRLENPYRHLDIFVKSQGKYTIDSEHYDSINTMNLPEFANVKIYSRLDDYDNKHLVEELKHFYSKCHFHLYSSKKEVKNEVETEDIHQFIDDEKKLAMEYIQKNVDEELVTEVVDTIMNNWSCSTKQKGTQWELLQVKFTNMFSYGKDNVINFSQNHGNIIGIFGENSVGKSTIVEIITFLLFNKITRFSHGNSTPREIINFAEKKASGSVKFKYGKDVYLITKTFSRGKTGKISITEKFFLLHEDGTEEELTGEQKKETDKFIQNIIGNYDVFIYTNLFLQQQEKSFRDLTTSEKKKFLYEIFGYNWFEKFEKEKKEQLKTVSVEEKHLKTLTNNQCLTSFDEKIETFTNELDSSKNTLSELKKQSSSIDGELKSLYHQLTFPIEDLKSKSNSFEKSFKQQSTQLEKKLQNLIKEKENLIEQSSVDDVDLESYEKFKNDDFYQKYSPTSETSSKREWNKFKDTIDFDFDITKSSETIKNVNDEINHLSSQLNKVEKKFVWKNKNKSHLETELHEKKNELLDIEKKIKKYKKKIFTIDEKWNNKTFELQKIISEEEILQHKISNLIEKRNDCLTIEFNKDCSSCCKNPYYLNKLKYDKEIEEVEELKAKSKKKVSSLKKYFESKTELPKTIGSKNLLQIIQNTTNEQTKIKNTIAKYETEHKEITNSFSFYENSIYFYQNLELQESIDTNKKIVEQLSTKKDVYLYYLENKNCFNYIQMQYDKDIRNIQSTISIQKKLENVVSEIDKLEKDIYLEKSKYKEKQEKWNVDLKLYGRIQSQNNEITQINKEIDNLNSSIYQMKNNLQNTEKEKKEWIKNDNAWKDKNNQLKIIQNIIKILDKDGLPLFLLSKKVKMIEEQINELIQPFLPKRIVFSIEKKSIDVGIKTNLDNHLCNYLGGMESFIVDLSFKLTFSKFSMIPKSNFFIIDEGISVMDQKMIYNINHLFNFLSNLTSNVLLISHIPQVKDWVTTSLDVYKKGEHSYITTKK